MMEPVSVPSAPPALMSTSTKKLLAASLASSVITDVETTTLVATSIALPASSVITPIETSLGGCPHRFSCVHHGISLETSFLAIAPPLGGDDLEEEYISELIDHFFKSLKRCLYLVLKGMEALFESLKSKLIYVIEGVKVVGGPRCVEPLGYWMSNLNRT